MIVWIWQNIYYFYVKKNKIEINKTKISKLLYIIYGGFLALYKRSILTERPKYFPYGPVFPKVYKNYDKLLPMQIVFSNDLKDIIDNALDTYGNMTAGQLTTLTHQAGTPWDIMNKNGAKFNEPLDDNDIYNYFNNNMMEDEKI
ncbi:MAG: hypothetical protein Ta2D_11180 [Rickettsiales bacterium]|nr:MAG: hypothetical protein Ta2D_11180 [Rickettsiales bacterium]